MASKKQLADTAIQNAFAEMRLGNKQVARSWAQRAIALAPELEDPWLILAALAGPRAGLEYLKQALKINPDSQRARRGLLDVQQRLEKISKVGEHTRVLQVGSVSQPQLETTAQNAIPRPPGGKTKTSIRCSHARWLGFISAFALAIALMMILFLAVSRSGNVKAHGLP